MFKKAFPLALVLTLSTVALSAQNDSDPDFDRLDGKGPSGKRVDVIEWEGNLEVHVYPGGSLKGLALKIDKRDRDKPVLVIGYRFDNAPSKTLIRRALLGVPLREGFRAYKDPSVSEYDKIIISNHSLSSQVVAWKLDPEPTQLYPDGHPELQKSMLAEAAAKAGEFDGNDASNRAPASSERKREHPETDLGAITPFSW